MQITIEIQNHMGIGPALARAVHAIGAIPRTMTRREARTRLSLLAEDLREASNLAREAAERMVRR